MKRFTQNKNQLSVLKGFEFNFFYKHKQARKIYE